MTRPAEATRCAICGRPNECAIANGKGATECWCATIRIDEAVLARVPEPKRGEVCICPHCAGERE